MQNSLSDRQAVWAFMLGCCAMVTIGVLLHIPMFLMGRSMALHAGGHADGHGTWSRHGADHRRLVDRRYGLLPRNIAAQRAASAASRSPRPRMRRSRPRIGG
jgi:putative MFS transporter